MTGFSSFCNLMWTKLPPPDFESVDNQLDTYLLVAMRPPK